jgi:ATP-dependent Lon protease
MKLLFSSKPKSKVETVKEINNIYKIDESLEYDEINVNKTLLDLINLGKSYTPELKNKYAFDYEKLYHITPCLIQLYETIGMDSIKKNIINQIIYFVLGLENITHLMNTVIYGPPGVGKTLLGQIIGNIYNKLGLVPNSDPKNDVKLKIYKSMSKQFFL